MEKGKCILYVFSDMLPEFYKLSKFMNLGAWLLFLRIQKICGMLIILLAKGTL